MHTQFKMNQEVTVKGVMGIVEEIEFYSRRETCPIFGKKVEEPAPLVRYKIVFMEDDLEFQHEWFAGFQIKRRNQYYL